MKKQLFFLFFLFVSALSLAQKQEPRLVLPVGIGHMDIRLETIVLNNDGSKLLTLYDNKIRFWDVPSGKELMSISEHNEYLSTLVFSPDGRYFLTVSSDGILDIWETSSGELIKTTFINEKDQILSAVFNPIGSMLIFITQNGLIGKWEYDRVDSEITQIGTMDSFYPKNFYGKSEYNLTINPKGDTVVISNAQRIDFWNVRNNEILFSLEDFRYSIMNVTFDLTGEKLFVSTGDMNFAGWAAYEFCMSQHELLLKLTDETSRVSNLIFSPSGDRILSTCENQGYLWDSSEGNLVGRLEGHSSWIKSASFIKNGNLILTTGDNSLRIWDAYNCVEKFSSIGSSDHYPLASVSSNGLVVATIIPDKLNRIEFWSLESFNCFQVIKGMVEPIDGIYFDKTDQIISTTSFGRIESWDPMSGACNFLIREQFTNYLRIDVYTDINVAASRILYYSASVDSIQIFDLISGDKIKRIKLEEDTTLLGWVKINDKADRILICYMSSSSRGPDVATYCLYNLFTGEVLQKEVDSTFSKYLLYWDSTLGLIKKIKRNNYSRLVNYYPKMQLLVLENDRNELVVVNSENEKVVVKTSFTNDLLEAFIYKENNLLRLIFVTRNLNQYDQNGEIFVWDFNDSKLLSKHSGKIVKENFEFNSNCIVSSINTNLNAHIWSINNKESVQLKNNNQLKVRFAEYNNNLNILITSDENTITIWDLASGNPIYERIQLENNNWLVKLPNSPYYMCSKDASKMLHYVTPSLKVIGFEQLDPVYNRPDIVMDSIGKYFGNSDGGMIDEYRKSWEKRIDRLGLDKEKLGKGEIAVPNAEIVGADAIAYENKAGKLNIKVSANDPKYPLRRFNVFVNEVPLYGSAGVSIAHLKKQVWDTTVSVPLSLGENKIQVSVMNELGLENFKYPTYVNYTPDKEIVAKTHYIGIGVNEFKESSHNLKYCVKDVRDLAREFASENKNVDTLLFTDKQVTKENILALKDYLNKTNVNDKVIISCSSHGLLDDSLNFYLAMYDVDFNNPKARGLKYEALESLLDGIPARQKLLLLDACNSGENDKTEVLRQELATNQNKMDAKTIEGAKGYIKVVQEENKSNFKKMNELFVNVRNNTGSVIISAAGGQESALEAIEVDGKTIKNGAFTYSILECLKQNEGKELKVNALKQYAEKRVEEITNGKQKPTSRQETMEVDWGVR
jgi:WD40 repeat protein